VRQDRKPSVPPLPPALVDRTPGESTHRTGRAMAAAIRNVAALVPRIRSAHRLSRTRCSPASVPRNGSCREAARRGRALHYSPARSLVPSVDEKPQVQPLFYFESRNYFMVTR
jgi:hypothetical protein